MKPPFLMGIAGGLLDNSNYLSEQIARRLKLKRRPIVKHPPAIGAALPMQMEWSSQSQT